MILSTAFGLSCPSPQGTDSPLFLSQITKFFQSYQQFPTHLPNPKIFHLYQFLPIPNSFHCIQSANCIQSIKKRTIRKLYTILTLYTCIFVYNLLLNFSQSRRKQNQHFRPLPKAPKSVNRRTQIFPVLPKANQKMRQSAKKSEKN